MIHVLTRLSKVLLGVLGLAIVVGGAGVAINTVAVQQREINALKVVPSVAVASPSATVVPVSPTATPAAALKKVIIVPVTTVPK